MFTPGPLIRFPCAGSVTQLVMVEASESTDFPQPGTSRMRVSSTWERPDTVFRASESESGVPTDTSPSLPVSGSAPPAKCDGRFSMARAAHETPSLPARKNKTHHRGTHPHSPAHRLAKTERPESQAGGRHQGPKPFSVPVSIYNSDISAHHASLAQEEPPAKNRAPHSGEHQPRLFRIEPVLPAYSRASSAPRTSKHALKPNGSRVVLSR